MAIGYWRMGGGVMGRGVIGAGGPGTRAMIGCNPRISGQMIVQVRMKLTGKRAASKRSICLNDLPQGPVLPPEDLPPLSRAFGARGRESTADADLPTLREAEYPRVIQQAKDHMDQFKDCVVLTRVGGFYELYLEQAEIYGPLLNLKVATKRTHKNISMAGFPFFQLSRYLRILVQRHKKNVAIAEELPQDPDTPSTVQKRRVTRIVTPGTLIDEDFLDQYSANYILAISAPDWKNVDREIDDHGNAMLDRKARDLEVGGRRVGLAWLDLSTGSFWTHVGEFSGLPAMVSKVAPKEVVLDISMKKDTVSDDQVLPLEEGILGAPSIADAIHHVLAEDHHVISYSTQGELQKVKDWGPMLETKISATEAKKFSQEEISAVNLVLTYLNGRLRESIDVKVEAPQRVTNLLMMTIDKNSLRSLEIKKTMRESAYAGSLLHAIRKTVTKGGTRLLTEWLLAPSISISVIQDRQNLVSILLALPSLRSSLTILLQRIHDSQRVVQKFALGRGSADDLLDLATTIQVTDHMVKIINEHISRANLSTISGLTGSPSIQKLLDRLSLAGPLKLAASIKNSIDESGLEMKHQMDEDAAAELLALAQRVIHTDGTQVDIEALPAALREAPRTRPKKTQTFADIYGEDNELWVMKPTASKTLKQLHNDLAIIKDEQVQLEQVLRDKYSAPSLVLRFMNGIGHTVHVKGKDTKPDAPIWTFPEVTERIIKASKSTRVFYNTEWTELSIRLNTVRQSIRSEENNILQTLREKVILNMVKIRRNATVLDELDIVASFASLAEEQNLTRPTIIDEPITNICGGRHPTVEGSLRIQGRTFTRNDCVLGRPHNALIWLITGPNMAGKSTFLRQNALLTILAQVGSFVPATSATLGIVDAIFSRVGSADNLYRDQSTFMVEMLETAQILKSATNRSFVIMDEIGRGTTPEDGLAVAWGALRHLAVKNGCRGLFATHFHDVSDLAIKEGFMAPPTESFASDVGKSGAGDLEDGTKAHLIKAYCTDVEELNDDGFVYVHWLKEGVNRKSHALKVAKLAGLPEEAIDTAKKVLEKMGHDPK